MVANRSLCEGLRMLLVDGYEVTKTFTRGSFTSWLQKNYHFFIDKSFLSGRMGVFVYTLLKNRDVTPLPFFSFPTPSHFSILPIKKL
uniref:Uncharacterized protein LOC107421841 n=1 Tax=Rhizophora mucronata TaxID=61149 RepID=A0A2P2JZ36_RHIMU